jgi:hypothetical protein
VLVDRHPPQRSRRLRRSTKPSFPALSANHGACSPVSSSLGQSRTLLRRTHAHLSTRRSTMTIFVTLFMLVEPCVAGQGFEPWKAMPTDLQNSVHNVPTSINSLLAAASGPHRARGPFLVQEMRSRSCSLAMLMGALSAYWSPQCGQIWLYGIKSVARRRRDHRQATSVSRQPVGPGSACAQPGARAPAGRTRLCTPHRPLVRSGNTARNKHLP